jgi:hypothetical protein
VNDTDTPIEPSAPSPHPLARDFARAIASSNAGRVLLLGFGSGRNVPPVLAAAPRVVILEDDAERARAASARFAGDGRIEIVHAPYGATGALAGSFAGALTTHALLHGNPASVGAAVANVRERLESQAPFFMTLASKSDPRYGQGDRLDADTYAAPSGSEAGVPHVFFDLAGVRALLDGFQFDALEERDASETAGAWAHAPHDAATLRHWFVWARRP